MKRGAAIALKQEIERSCPGCRVAVAGQVTGHREPYLYLVVTDLIDGGRFSIHNHREWQKRVKMAQQNQSFLYPNEHGTLSEAEIDRAAGHH